MEYIFGKKACFEAISNELIDELFVLESPKSSYLLNNFKNVKITIKDKNFFNKFKKINHQNFIGLIKKENKIKIFNNFEFFLNSLVNKEKSLILILDEIQDPGNFGAICRTCEAFGVEGIIFKKNNQSQINQTVIKTSLGSVYNLKFLLVANLSIVLDLLKKKDFWIISSSLSEKSLELNRFNDNFKKIALVVGNEEKGINNLILKKSDFILKIKMYGKIQSLNVSVSTGILLNHLKQLIK